MGDTANPDWDLMKVMKKAYESNHNAAQAARDFCGLNVNQSDIIEMAYELQQGSYLDAAESLPMRTLDRAEIVAGYLQEFLRNGDTLLDLGTGEGTVFSLLPERLEFENLDLRATDISWSRLNIARRLFDRLKSPVHVFASDLLNLPLASKSVDIIMTTNALEPNGGREDEIFTELFRVARRNLVLVEPLYELGSERAKDRMRSHGYVTGLIEAAEAAGGVVERFELSSFPTHNLHPTGLMVVKPPAIGHLAEYEGAWTYQCPVSSARLTDLGDCLYSSDFGIAYPKLREIPILRASVRILAAGLTGD